MKVEDQFETATEFAEFLTAAQTAASNDWETRFVGDVARKFEQYGAGMFVSEKQIAALNKIIEGG